MRTSGPRCCCCPAGTPASASPKRTGLNRRTIATKLCSLYQAAVEIDPSYAAAYVGIGSIYYGRFFLGLRGGTANLDLARENFERALALDPHVPGAVRGLMSIETELGHSDSNLEIASRAVAAGGPEVENLFIRAGAFFSTLPDLAVPLFKRITEIDPANPGALWFLVIANNWAGWHQQAIAAGEQYVARFGDDPEIHAWMGLSFGALGKPQQSDVHYDRAIQLFGDEPTNYVHLAAGHAARNRGDETRARQIWEQGAAILERRLTASPENSRWSGGLAFLYASLGRNQEAARLAPPVQPGREAYLNILLSERNDAVEYMRTHVGPEVRIWVNGNFQWGYQIERVLSDPRLKSRRDSAYAYRQHLRERYAHLAL